MQRQKPFRERPKVLRPCAGQCGTNVEVAPHRGGEGWCSTCRVRKHRGRSITPGACCELCGEADPVVLAPEHVADSIVVLCRNDAARARRRHGITLDELRLELASRGARTAAA